MRLELRDAIGTASSRKCTEHQSLQAVAFQLRHVSIVSTSKEGAGHLKVGRVSVFTMHECIVYSEISCPTSGLHERIHCVFKKVVISNQNLMKNKPTPDTALVSIWCCLFTFSRHHIRLESRCLKSEGMTPSMAARLVLAGTGPCVPPHSR